LLTLQQADESSSASSSPDAPAPSVTTFGLKAWTITTKRDVSTAPGLTHLRNALLEDRSFDWEDAMESTQGEDWPPPIAFGGTDPAGSMLILFGDNFARALKRGPGRATLQMVSTRPIAAGLAETINDWSQ